ncbi:MAG: TonB-dependent receptor, partial [Planctomycetota bacterium]
RSFEAPQFTELLNVRFDFGGNGSLFHNPLRAQRATSAEFGTRGREGIVSWEMAYYYAWLHREMITSSPFPGANFVSNGNRTAHQGVEFAAEVTLAEGMAAAKTEQMPGDRIYVRSSYTWNHFKFRNDPVYGDNHLPGVPEHVLIAELGYIHPSGAFISTNVEFVPKEYAADYANSFFADPYATYGVKLGYRRDTGLSFFAEVRNLSDQRYISSLNQVGNAGGADLPNFHPAFARAYYAGMELRW